MSLERLWVSQASIAPCHVVGLAGEGRGWRGDGVVIRVVAEVRVDVRRNGTPVGRYIGDQCIAGRAGRERVDIQCSVHVSHSGVCLGAALERDVQVAIRVGVAQSRQHMPATTAAIDLHRCSLDAGEASQVEALHQNIAYRMEASIIPDDAHRACRVTHRNAREVTHREATIAWDECGLHRGDTDPIGGCWPFTL